GVSVGEVPERPLNLAAELLQHRPQGFEDVGQLRRLGRVPLQVLGLGEGELELLCQGPSEVVAADRDRPLPDDPPAVGDDQVGPVRPDVERDHALFLPDRLGLGRLPVRAAPFQELIGHKVGKRERGHLDEVDFQFDRLEVANEAVDHVPLHREEADLRIHREAVGDRALAHLLVVPDDLVEWEGDLLLGLELDDVNDLFLFDRGQLDEPGQARLAGDAHGHEVALGRVPGEELLQGLAGEFVRVRVRLRKDLRVLDVVERRGRHGPVDHLETTALDGALTDVDAPDAWIDWHGGELRGREDDPTRAKAGPRTGCRQGPGGDVETVYLRTGKGYHAVYRTVNHHN